MRKDARENRQKILQAAGDLIAEKGIQAMSMKDVAERAHIGTGTLYRNYANKGDLCLGLANTNIQRFVRDSEALLATDTDPEEKLRQILVSYLRFHEVNRAPLDGLGADSQRRLVIYRSDLYQQLVNVFVQVLQPLRAGLTPADVQFEADMLIAMMRDETYSFERNVRHLSNEDILQHFSNIFTFRMEE